MGDFESGQQPCNSFNPSMDGNEYAIWENEHECFCKRNGTLCGGKVSHCDSCNRDHHAGGYESCTGCSSERKASQGASHPSLHKDKPSKETI